MTWQEPVVVFIVGAALGYLVWKLGFEGRTKKTKKKRGPDVTIGRLRRSAKKNRKGS